jgi:hypothetical protein
MMSGEYLGLDTTSLMTEKLEICVTFLYRTHFTLLYSSNMAMTRPFLSYRYIYPNCNMEGIERPDVAVKLQTCILGIFCSNLSQDTGYRDRLLSDFLSSSRRMLE